MSDNHIVLVPVRPLFKPNAKQRNDLESEFLQIFGSSEKFIFETSDKVMFFDCGANFENIHCPICRAEISIDWWAKSMDSDFDGDKGFKLLQYQLPCCQNPLSLNKLKYSFHQAFGCFGITFYEIDSTKIAQYKKIAEKILNVSLHIIYQHI